MNRHELIAKGVAVLRLRREDMRRRDLITKAATALGVRRDDLVRVVRVMIVTVVGVVGVAMIISVPGWGATHALLGIHKAPTAKANTVPLTVDQAKKILTRSLTAAYLGETKDGAASDAALRAAYTGQGLRGAGGRVKLASVQPAVATSPLVASQPKLLAVSRGFGYPRFIVAQTVASDGGVPILHLLTSPNAETPYRISMSVEMVPPATVEPFDRLSQGSSLVTNSAGLAVAPAKLLSLYAAQMVFPAKATSQPPFVADSFSVQMREGAAGVARAVASQATFTQVHKVVPDSLYAVQQASGDALVFGVIERTDLFTVKKDQNVNTAANKAFVLLTGKKVVARKASITTLEFVVFADPRSTGKATLVAAREQIVAGSGS